MRGIIPAAVAFHRRGGDTRIVAPRIGIAAVIAVLSATLGAAPPAAVAAPPAPVKIEPAKFDPAVVVIAPGMKVRWTNGDTVRRALTGEVESPPIAPGAKYEERFPRPGIFEYADAGNPLIAGTVIVAAGGGAAPHYPPAAGPSTVTHRWRVQLRFDVRDSWKYMDGKFMSFDGVCNAQVGDGSRQVGFEAVFPEVTYSRIGKLEVMSGKSTPFRIQRYREAIASKTSDPSGGTAVDCGDGSKDPPANIEQNCSHNYAGLRVRAGLSWSPKIGQGRMLWQHDYLGRRPPFGANCGHGLFAGDLVGLDVDDLPWDPGAGDALLYDAGRTNPLLASEARALRAGRAVTIEREFEFAFTADCCLEWHEEGKPGTYVRVGARHLARGRVTIRFSPH
jgi:plastocyanin